MSFKYATSLVAFALLSRVSAHGIVQGIVANGVWQSGYQPSFKYSNPPPVVAGWSIPDDSDLGFVSDYTSPDMICHKGATPGGSYVQVAAGDSIELQWTVWPESHHGPMIDYLASCGDDCTTVDKTKLLFNKIDEAGLINGSPAPGTWASDTMIANNNSWTVTIPSSIAPGKYVLRHETIALHSANNLDGAQNYPQCINIEVSGSGTDSLTGGTLGTELYTNRDPGIFVNIYYPPLTNYTIPGPALIGSGNSGSQPSASPSASVSASSTSSGISITATPVKPSAVGPFLNSTTTASSTTTITTTITPTLPEETECTDTESAALTTGVAVTASVSKPAQNAVSPTGASSAPAVPTNDAPSNVNPVSFTSTVTGRIGKPTRFVCYIDDTEYTLSS